MIKTLSLSAVFLLAISAPAHALTKVNTSSPQAVSDADNDILPLSKGETLFRTENEPSFSLAGVKKDMVMEYRTPVKGRLSAGFSMTYSYDANDGTKAQDSSAMVHLRLKF